MYDIPNLVFADRNGNIYDHPELKTTVRSENFNFVPYELELIELPENTQLYLMPDTHPVAYNQMKAGMETFTGGSAVAAILPPGYLRLFMPGYEKLNEKQLPMQAFTAVGWMNDKFVVPALKMDADSKWNPKKFLVNDSFNAKVADTLEKFPKNRLYKHLAKCALHDGCPAAMNVFYGRWECPVPTASKCNSQCIGCISGEKGVYGGSVERINFTPSPREIVEIALNHAERAGDEAIISFGTGCEGDPITVAETIAKAVEVIKRKKPELTINFKSNCSEPEKLKMVLDAGVDSICVSLNSVRHDTYEAYYRPQDYRFDDVLKSIELANRCGVYVSLDMLVMPGINDRESETESLLDFLGAYKVDLLQMNNMALDPDYLFSIMKFKTEEIFGIKNMLKMVKKKYKNLKFGSFNRPAKLFDKDFKLPDLKRR